jgi:hypothetical protein
MSDREKTTGDGYPSSWPTRLFHDGFAGAMEQIQLRTINGCVALHQSAELDYWRRWQINTQNTQLAFTQFEGNADLGAAVGIAPNTDRKT